MIRLWSLLPLIPLCQLLAGSLNAQTAASSDPVGYVSATINVGLNPLAVTMLNPDLVRTSATSFSGNSVTLSGQTNVGLLLAAGEPYYVEVYSGPLKGDRFDVNTPATIAAANGTVVLDDVSANNTFPVSGIGSALNDATLAVRKHVTLEQLQSAASAPLVGSNAASGADQIQFFSTEDNAYVSYFLRADGVTWRRVGTTFTANKIPIPPGVGVFVEKKMSAVTFTMVGAVRNNDFAQPWKRGLQLVAPGYPMESSPASLGASSGNGWVGNNSASAADQIQVFDPLAKAYNSYFLRGDGSTWRRVGTTATVTSSNVVHTARSFFVKRNQGDSKNIVLNPLAQ